MPFRTISGLGITFACLTALVTSLLGVITVAVVHREVERQIDQRIDVETAALLDLERERGFAALIAVVTTRDRHAAPGAIGYRASPRPPAGRELGYILTDATGKRRAGSLAAELPPAGRSARVKFIRADGSRGEAQASTSALPGGGRLVVAGDRAAVKAMDRLLVKLFAAAFGTLVLLGAAMVLLFGRIIGKRLREIESAAMAIDSGDLAPRVPLDGTGVELDRLAVQLNRMLERIGKLVDNLRAVSSDLAHDLRTPLSRLIAKLEEAAERATDPKQQALLDGALGEIDDVLDLFAGLLSIAEIDGHTIRGRFVPLDLGNAASEIAEAHRPTIEDAGMSLTIDVERTIVQGDRALLQRLVGNLLDNVLTHAPAARSVSVVAASRDGRAIVRVQDDGPGIPVSESERVFERHVRLDASRTTPGHGLGLSIVGAIAAAHGGSVAIVPSGNGTIVEFAMPLR